MAGNTIKQWSEITGLPVRYILLRLRDHYDLDQILAPKKKIQVPRGSIKEFVVDCAQKQGVSRKAIYMRLNRGWTKDEVVAGAREKYELDR